MAAEIVGTWTLHALLLAACLQIPVHLAYLRKRTSLALRRLSRSLPMVQFVLAASSAGLLLGLLLIGNLHFPYVAEYTGPGLAFVYRLAGLWAGNAGSLVFWLLVLSLYGALISLVRHHRHEGIQPFVLIVLSVISVFYALLVNVEANPFMYVATALPANGLNPLLQNPGMTVHPVNVYLGFIGMTVPFAYTISSLMTKTKDPFIMQVTRRWTLIAWLFLSIGIVYGAHWSYEELGWGGYWSWDPVENASLLPWLVTTAYLHSAMAEERRGRFVKWNRILSVLAFSLTIVGTYLTRSGVIWSIHAFANGPIGTWYLVLLAIVLAASLFLFIWRWKSMSIDVLPIEGVVSREGGFLINNLLLVSLTVAILWGTLYPLTSESITGHSSVLSNSFYTAVAVPIGLALGWLMAISPILRYKSLGFVEFFAKTGPMMLVSVFLGALTEYGLSYVVDGEFSWLALLAFFVVWLTALLHTRELVAEVAHRRGKSSRTTLRAVLELISHRRRQWGASIVHLAVALIFCGIAASSLFQASQQVTLASGQSASVGAITATFLGMSQETGSDRTQLIANVLVRSHGRTLGVLQPAASFYNDASQPSTDVAIASNPLRDIYIAFLGTAGKSEVVLDIHVSPLISMIWFGGYLFIAGMLISLWPMRERVPEDDNFHSPLPVQKGVRIRDGINRLPPGRGLGT